MFSRLQISFIVSKLSSEGTKPTLPIPVSIIVDFCYVGATLLICLVAGLGFGIVREGTVIFAVANGVLINLFLPYVEKLFTAVENLCGVKKSIV